MPKPHKHAEVIKAWADGHKIQTKTTSNIWEDLDTNYPTWANAEYRIKPSPKIITGFVDPLMLEYSKNPYAVFRTHRTTAQDINCTLIINPDE